jgi:hypothetical protein
VHLCEGRLHDVRLVAELANSSMFPVFPSIASIMGVSSLMVVANLHELSPLSAKSSSAKQMRDASRYGRRCLRILTRKGRGSGAVGSSGARIGPRLQQALDDWLTGIVCCLVQARPPLHVAAHQEILKLQCSGIHTISNSTYAVLYRICAVARPRPLARAVARQCASGPWQQRARVLFVRACPAHRRQPPFRPARSLHPSTHAPQQDG